MKQNSELRDLCCLCGESFLCSFGCGFAALGASWWDRISFVSPQP